MLSANKCRKNVESFVDACSRIGLAEVCSSRFSF